MTNRNGTKTKTKFHKLCIIHEVDVIQTCYYYPLLYNLSIATSSLPDSILPMSVYLYNCEWTRVMTY